MMSLRGVKPRSQSGVNDEAIPFRLELASDQVLQQAPWSVSLACHHAIHTDQGPWHTAGTARRAPTILRFVDIRRVTRATDLGQCLSHAITQFTRTEVRGTPWARHAVPLRFLILPRLPLRHNHLRVADYSAAETIARRNLLRHRPLGVLI